MCCEPGRQEGLFAGEGFGGGVVMVVVAGRRVVPGCQDDVPLAVATARLPTILCRLPGRQKHHQPKGSFAYILLTQQHCIARVWPHTCHVRRPARPSLLFLRRCRHLGVCFRRHRRPVRADGGGHRGAGICGRASRAAAMGAAPPARRARPSAGVNVNVWARVRLV
eukprot:366217-Chlamydomonas_euryale.AAC.1